MTACVIHVGYQKPLFIFLYHVKESLHIGRRMIGYIYDVDIAIYERVIVL